MIPDKSITEIETVVKGIFEKSRKRSFLCAAFCATERGKTNRQTWGANRQTRGTQAEKDSRPYSGGCLVRLVLYHRSALYNTSKEKTKNVSAPRVASGTKRTLVQVPCRSRSLVGACCLVSVKPGATDLARGCLTRRAAARYNRNENAVGAGGNRGGRGAERRHDERLSDHHTGKRPGGAARVHHPEKAGTPGDRSQAGVARGASCRWARVPQTPRSRVLCVH